MRGQARFATLAATATLAFYAAGCFVSTNKHTNGDGEDVSIRTPFGGMHVNSGQNVDTGLPVYPGSTPEQKDGDGNKNGAADVHMGFGDFELRVQAASYVTSDSAAKVQAFYKSALGKYGAVVTCRGNAPVGEPTRTDEGLTCADDDEHHHVSGVNTDGDLTLKAGSRRRQHLVSIDSRKSPGTHFALVALVLPGRGHSEGDVE